MPCSASSAAATRCTSVHRRRRSFTCERWNDKTLVSATRDGSSSGRSSATSRSSTICRRPPPPSHWPSPHSLSTLVSKNSRPLWVFIQHQHYHQLPLGSFHPVHQLSIVWLGLEMKNSASVRVDLIKFGSTNAFRSAWITAGCSWLKTIKVRYHFLLYIFLFDRIFWENDRNNWEIDCLLILLNGTLIST